MGVAVDGRILVADDDADFRGFMRNVIVTAGHEVVEAETGEAALRIARELRPRLVILDVDMPPGSGYEVCRALREDLPGLPIMIVSGTRTRAFDRVAGLLIGADDYLTKPFDPDELLARVHALMRRAGASTNGAATKLTKRELEILRLLAEGLEQREIARRLVISPKTVGTHIEHILAKLGVRSRAQAVALAYRQDLVGA